jgi:cell division transport system permease protein
MAQQDKKVKRRVGRSYLISTVSIALLLFMLGSVSYLILNALNVSDKIKEGVIVRIMLQDGLSDEQTAELCKKIKAHEVVRQVNYLSKEKAAEQFIRETGEDFKEFTEFNPLPNSFEVGLTARSSDKEVVSAFARSVETMSGVSEVDYPKGVVERISSNINILYVLLFFYGVTLLVITLVLLNNTVRMTIMARRHIISTMKLVGATKGFIMRPFVGRAVVTGMVAGVIATGMLAALIVGIMKVLPEVTLITDRVLLGSIVGGMIGGGVIISLVFTIFTVRKFVRMSSGKINMY